MHQIALALHYHFNAQSSHDYSHTSRIIINIIIVVTATRVIHYKCDTFELISDIQLMQQIALALHYHITAHCSHVILFCSIR